MGLDMFAFAAKTAKQDPTEPVAIILGEEDESGDYIYFDGESPIEIDYWRKFNALHNWMQELYIRKGGKAIFNCIKLPLTLEDLAELGKACEAKSLKPVEGFFWGSQEEVQAAEYLEVLKFIRKARDYISNGYTVCYDSWW